jgi:hypothetical protein
MEVSMTREQDWAIFEKACEITASAVRGTMGSQTSQPASFVGDVFREVHRALHETAEGMPSKVSRAGF